MHGHEPRYTKEASKEIGIGNFFEGAAITTAVLSLLAFVVGAVCSVSAIAIDEPRIPAVQAQ
jgi:hypothetical protein